MPKYYCFRSKKSFFPDDTKSGILYLAKQVGGIVFRHVDGIPNPWFCYRVFPDGSYETKNGKKVVYKPSDIDKLVKEHFDGRKEKSLLRKL